MQKLLNQQDQPVNTGDTVRAFDGEILIITGWQEPQHTNSTGRIYTMTTDGRQIHSEYYPSVCDLRFE